MRQRTDRAGFSRLLGHPARKLIVHGPGARTGGTQHNDRRLRSIKVTVMSFLSEKLHRFHSPQPIIRLVLV